MHTLKPMTWLDLERIYKAFVFKKIKGIYMEKMHKKEEHRSKMGHKAKIGSKMHEKHHEKHHEKEKHHKSK